MECSSSSAREDLIFCWWICSCRNRV